MPILVSSGEDPEEYVSRLPPRPLLVIHGTEDHIVPFDLGQRLYEAASEPKELYVAEGARHATPWLREGPRFERRVVEFFVGALQ